MDSFFLSLSLSPSLPLETWFVFLPCYLFWCCQQLLPQRLKETLIHSCNRLLHHRFLSNPNYRILTIAKQTVLCYNFVLFCFRLLVVGWLHVFYSSCPAETIISSSSPSACRWSSSRFPPTCFLPMKMLGKDHWPVTSWSSVMMRLPSHPGSKSTSKNSTSTLRAWLSLRRSSFAWRLWGP